MNIVFKAFVWYVICLSLLLFPAISIAATNASKLIAVYSLLLDGPTPTYHKVNVLTEGLAGDGLTLILNGKEELAIPADGSTSFPILLRNLTNFEITIKDSVTDIDQACRIINGTGIISFRDASVFIDCSVLDYSVGGTVTGLDGLGLTLVLKNLDDDSLQKRIIKANGTFALAALPDKTAYEASILAQPDNNSQTCTLTNATGTVSGASVSNLGVNCVTNQVPVQIYRYDLAAGDSITIVDNGPGWIPPPTTVVNGTDTDGALVRLSSPWVVDGGNYNFAVLNPSIQGDTCYLSNKSGVANNVVSMDLRCFPALSRMGTVGGIVNDVGVGSSPFAADVKLSLNDGLDFITVKGGTGDTPFAFDLPLWLLDGRAPNTYSVSIARQPRDAVCTVDANATGIMSVEVTNVHVQCTSYDEPVARVVPDVFVPNDGSLDASLTSYGDSSSVNITWDTPSIHDFSFTGNGTTDPTGVTITTDKFEDPLYLDEVVCANNPLCLDDIISNGLFMDATVASTNTTLHVIGDEGHESTDTGNTFVYDESLAYVRYGASGSGASPNDPAGDIKVGINYARNNGKRGVAISQGTYTVDVDSGPIHMVEGVSLFGGFSASTWAYDPVAYTTFIRGSGTGVPDETSGFTPVATVVAGPEITSKTAIKGLYIFSPNLLRDLATTALLIKGGDVTVKENTLRGFTRGDIWSGLTIIDGSEAFIRNNTIIADGAPLSGELTEAVGGAGIVIYWSQPTIESNRIRGGGAVGQGIVVFNAHPNIFNNIVLGCEDSANQQVCYGVKYLAEIVSETDIKTSGGKLYNNVILGGVPSPNNEQPDGTDGYAVFTVGPTSTPNLVNNILFSQNGAHYSVPEYNRTACISSVTTIPVGIPASIYNNACIDGTKIVSGGAETLFHVFVYQASSSLGSIIGDFFRDSHNALLGWLLPVGNDYDESVRYLPFSVIPFPKLNHDERLWWGERNGTESNAEDLWVALSQVTNELIWEAAGWDDFYVWVSSFSTFTPSGGNVDIDRIDFFADFGGPDNVFSTIEDNDWSLTGSAPTEIIEGGKCVAPDVHLDMDRGAARTPGWTVASGCAAETGFSMGAYEYDY